MVKHKRTCWAPYHLGRWQMELLRQKDNGQFLPSREHLWMHQCWVEEGWKSALWSPKHRVVWPCVCRENHRTGVCFMEQSAKTKNKIILQRTQTGIKYFPLFSKQKRIGTCGWWSSSSREMLAETTTSEKGKHWESCGQGRYRHRWQLNTACPHTIASQNHYVRNKPCPQLLKHHISHPRGCRKARFALQCPH